MWLTFLVVALVGLASAEQESVSAFAAADQSLFEGTGAEEEWRIKFRRPRFFRRRAQPAKAKRMNGGPPHSSKDAEIAWFRKLLKLRVQDLRPGDILIRKEYTAANHGVVAAQKKLKFRRGFKGAPYGTIYSVHAMLYLGNGILGHASSCFGGVVKTPLKDIIPNPFATLVFRPKNPRAASAAVKTMEWLASENIAYSSRHCFTAGAHTIAFGPNARKRALRVQQRRVPVNDGEMMCSEAVGYCFQSRRHVDMTIDVQRVTPMEMEDWLFKSKLFHHGMRFEYKRRDGKIMPKCTKPSKMSITQFLFGSRRKQQQAAVKRNIACKNSCNALPQTTSHQRRVLDICYVNCKCENKCFTQSVALMEWGFFKKLARRTGNAIKKKAAKVKRFVSKPARARQLHFCVKQCSRSHSASMEAATAARKNAAAAAARAAAARKRRERAAAAAKAKAAAAAADEGSEDSEEA